MGALIALTLVSARADEVGTSASGTNAITLQALVADALDNNPELRFYEAEIAAARAGRKTAGLPANPEFSGSVGQKTVRGGGLSGEGVAWSASVMQPFEWPGRLGLRKAIANRDIELAELGLGRFKAALAARVRLLGYELFAAQDRADAAQEVAQRFKALREVLVQRDPAGLTPLLEMRVIEATELTAQRAAGEAELGAESALLELNQLRGVRTATRTRVRQTPLTFGSLPPLETLLAAARTNNFQLRTRAVELAQQGFRVDLAKNERFPAITVGPQISQERAGEREQIAGVGVSLPLPLWNRNTANVETAKARQAQAEVSLAVAQRDVERQVMQAARTYEAKRRQMENWKPDSVKHFKDAAELADRHYRLGAVPISTYVELQKQYLEAVQALLDTRRDTLDAAQQLELLTGLAAPVESAKEERP
jgi:cobalt-zinc-cadmium efflux system outer membrane protein